MAAYENGPPRLVPNGGGCNAGGKIVWGDCPSGWYQCPVGFTRTASVAAGGAATAESKVQKIYRCKAFVIGSEIASYYTVSTINVGVGGQQASTQPMPGSMFSEVSTQNCLGFETAQPGIDMTVNATNIDTEAHPFHCGMFGYVSGPAVC